MYILIYTLNDLKRGIMIQQINHYKQTTIGRYNFNIIANDTGMFEYVTKEPKSKGSKKKF